MVTKLEAQLADAQADYCKCVGGHGLSDSTTRFDGHTKYNHSYVIDVHNEEED
jgi:hypothetical protein